jgi:hypothetical protein
LRYGKPQLAQRTQKVDLPHGYAVPGGVEEIGTIREKKACFGLLNSGNVELLALMLRLWLAFGRSITELISVHRVVAERLPAHSLGYAMIGPLEVLQKEDRST